MEPANIWVQFLGQKNVTILYELIVGEVTGPVCLSPRLEDVFTYVQKTVHKGENCLTKWWLTLQGHNFVNNGPILTILAPLDSQG